MIGRKLLGVLGLAALITVGAGTSVRGQTGMAGGGRSLGGYGAGTIGLYYGNGGTTYVPYGGMAAGLVGQRGTSMAPSAVIRTIPTTPIGGAGMLDAAMTGRNSATAGMGASGGMSPTISVRGYPPLLPASGMSGGMPGTSAARRAAGPGFGYPFREPASLTGGVGAMAP